MVSPFGPHWHLGAESRGCHWGPWGEEEQGPADRVSLELKGREEGLPASRRHRGLEAGEGSGWVGKEPPATPEPEP